MAILIAGGPLPLVAQTVPPGQAGTSLPATQVQVAAVTAMLAAKPADREARPLAYGTKGQISSGKSRAARAVRRDDQRLDTADGPGQLVDEIV